MRNRWIPPEDYAEILRRLGKEYAAICELLRLTGFRLDDLLHTRNYQWEKKTLSLREAKTRHLREIELTPEMKEQVRHYREAVGELKYPRHKFAYFIRAKRCRPADRAKRCRSTVYRHFSGAVRDAGFQGKGYTVHSLRKMYAHEAYRRLGSLTAVQKDLGHKSISTTLLYVIEGDFTC